MVYNDRFAQAHPDFDARQAGAPSGLSPEELQAFMRGVSSYRGASGSLMDGSAQGGTGGNPQAFGQAYLDSYRANRGQGAGGGAGAGGTGTTGSVWANTEGRANELRGDPNIDAAQDFLRGVVGGQNLPYSEGSLNAMRAQHGRGTADAEAAQMATLRDTVGATGGSIYDPGYQSASREAESTRQGRNLDYAGQLQADASRVNFSGQMQGAGQLAATTTAHNAQINALLGQAAGYHAQEFQDTNQRSMPQGYTGNLGVNMPQAPQATQAPQPPAPGPGNWASPTPYRQPGPYDMGGNQAGAASYQAPQQQPSAASGIDWSQGWTAPPPPQQPYQRPASGTGPVQTFGQDQYAYKPQKQMTTYSTRRTA